MYLLTYISLMCINLCFPISKQQEICSYNETKY